MYSDWGSLTSQVSQIKRPSTFPPQSTNSCWDQNQRATLPQTDMNNAHRPVSVLLCSWYRTSTNKTFTSVHVTCAKNHGTHTFCENYLWFLNNKSVTIYFLKINIFGRNKQIKNGNEQNLETHLTHWRLWSFFVILLTKITQTPENVRTKVPDIFRSSCLKNDYVSCCKNSVNKVFWDSSEHGPLSLTDSISTFLILKLNSWI